MKGRRCRDADEQVGLRFQASLQCNEDQLRRIVRAENKHTRRKDRGLHLVAILPCFDCFRI